MVGLYIYNLSMQPYFVFRNFLFKPQRKLWFKVLLKVTTMRFSINKFWQSGVLSVDQTRIILHSKVQMLKISFGLEPRA